MCLNIAVPIVGRPNYRINAFKNGFVSPKTPVSDTRSM